MTWLLHVPLPPAIFCLLAQQAVHPLAPVHLDRPPHRPASKVKGRGRVVAVAWHVGAVLKGLYRGRAWEEGVDCWVGVSISRHEFVRSSSSFRSCRGCEACGSPQQQFSR